MPSVTVTSVLFRLLFVFVVMRLLTTFEMTREDRRVLAWNQIPKVGELAALVPPSRIVPDEVADRVQIELLAQNRGDRADNRSQRRVEAGHHSTPSQTTDGRVSTLR